MNSKGTSWIDRQQEWTMKVDEDLVRKSLDLPKRPTMNIVNGMGWKELAIIGAMIAAAIVGTAWGVSLLADKQPSNAGYDIEFFDADGNPIRLDRWPGTAGTP